MESTPRLQPLPRHVLQVLTYDMLQAQLSISTVRDLEDFLITDCFYTGRQDGRGVAQHGLTWGGGLLKSTGLEDFLTTDCFYIGQCAAAWSPTLPAQPRGNVSCLVTFSLFHKQQSVAFAVPHC